MPVTEIDEADLLRLRRVSERVGKMSANPSAKRKLLEALKEIDPEDPSVKELDKPDPIQARFDELAAANAKLEKQIADDKAERERNERLGKIQSDQEAGFAALRAAKWTSEGIDKVKKVMEEKGILDVAIAANWIESQMPPQNPVTPGGGPSWNLMPTKSEMDANADLAALIDSKGENDPLLRKMAYDAIGEVRGMARR